MPYKKKIYRRKKLRRIKKVPRSLNMGGITKLKRSRFIQVISATTLGPTYYALQFALSDFTTVNEFTQLFEQYRITKIRLQFMPKFLTENSMVNINANVPFIIVAPDPDDANVPVSANEIWQKAGCRTIQGNKPFTVNIYPKAATYLYTGAASGYGPSNNWINCDYPGVLYYGLKIVMEQTGVNGFYQYNIIGTYSLEFKGVR